MPDGDEQVLHDVEADAEAELAMLETSCFEQALSEPVETWQFDPVDAQREQVRLRSLLDAVETVTGDRRHGLSADA